MNDRYGTPPMFTDIPEPAVAEILTDTSGGTGPIKYVRYRPKNPPRCDDCAAAFIHDPNAPHSLPAKFTRKQEGCKDLLVCYLHKQRREEREAL